MGAYFSMVKGFEYVREAKSNAIRKLDSIMSLDSYQGHQGRLVTAEIPD